MQSIKRCANSPKVFFTEIVLMNNQCDVEKLYTKSKAFQLTINDYYLMVITGVVYAILKRKKIYAMSG